MVIKLGLIVNPVAGMGGSVGLKGTDNGIHTKAVELGASPITPQRTKETLTAIKQKHKIQIFAAPGAMGGDFLKTINISNKIVGNIPGNTTADDTKRIAKELLSQSIDLLIFVGGDGTARDILDAVGTKLPVVAVPSGVKIYSSVFANSPRAAASIIDAFIDGTDLSEKEVLDIDEIAFRNNQLASKLYGYLLVPNTQEFIQLGKSASESTMSETENKIGIAEWIVEEMDEETLYILGPGTTVKAISDYLNQPKTLLGVDALLAKKIIKNDINAMQIEKLLGKYEKRSIIITPLGGNGFVFGRGNKQFTPDIIRKVGKNNITTISTISKLRQLQCLRVDTGDFELDLELSGYKNVIVGYQESRVTKIAC